MVWSRQGIHRISRFPSSLHETPIFPKLVYQSSALRLPVVRSLLICLRKGTDQDSFDALYLRFNPVVDVKGLHVVKRPKKLAPLGAVNLVVLVDLFAKRTDSIQCPLFTI